MGVTVIPVVIGVLRTVPKGFVREVEGVLCILQNSNITGVSLSDCLVSYPGHTLGERVLPLYRDAVCVFHSPQPTRQFSEVLRIFKND